MQRNPQSKPVAGRDFDLPRASSSSGARGAFSGRLQRLSTTAISALPILLLSVGCNRNRFPDVPAGYREFAYVANSASDTVSVLDLVYLRPDRTLQVGVQPSGIAANPTRNEVYVVNTGVSSGNGSVSVIDTGANQVVATIPVHKLPYFIDVDSAGRRAYVANSGSNTVSILDLDRRREIGVIGTGEQPGLARISPDMRSLLVTNRGSGSVSVFTVVPYEKPKVRPADGIAKLPRAVPEKLHLTPRSSPKTSIEPLPVLRAAFPGCPGATDAVILANPSKAFIACSAGHQVMVISLAIAPETREARENPSLLTDHMLTLLDVGQTPVQLALKPDTGQIFCSNFGSDSISAIDTETNEVDRTDAISSHPVRSIVSSDDSTLWISNFGSDSISIWGIDDGHLLDPGSVPTGRGPDALAFSADEHLLLAVDSHSADVAVIRTVDRNGPGLFTLLPVGGSPSSIAIKAMQSK